MKHPFLNFKAEIVVIPSIVAVALAIGVRRLLSPENIYTIKLRHGRQLHTKALHTTCS